MFKHLKGRYWKGARRHEWSFFRSEKRARALFVCVQVTIPDFRTPQKKVVKSWISEFWSTIFLIRWWCQLSYLKSNDFSKPCNAFQYGVSWCADHCHYLVYNDFHSHRFWYIVHSFASTVVKNDRINSQHWLSNWNKIHHLWTTVKPAHSTQFLNRNLLFLNSLFCSSSSWKNGSFCKYHLYANFPSSKHLFDQQSIDCHSMIFP